MSFQNLSIRNKLTALMMVISALILLLVGSLYIVEEVHSSRTLLTREMTTLGSTLGDSCKNLLMLRQIDATENILASLRVQKNIRAAYLFDEDGVPVAQYLDPSDMQFLLSVFQVDFADPAGRFWVDLPEPKATTSWRHFGLFLPIMHVDRQVGSIYLLSDLKDLYGQIHGAVFIVLLTLGVLLFLSWWLAGKLQRPVSTPLLNLANTMGAVSLNNDYSVRVAKQGRDEIGLLVDGFNQMLEQIESHRLELVEQQQSLEKTVEKRTEELRQMVSVLEVAKRQAEAASEAKSQFLANVTHELRTPLVGVLGMNELLFRTAMDEQQKMLATTVQNSGEDLLQLINNVLDYSKIEAGKLQLEEAEFSLYKVVDEVLALLAGTAAEKGLELCSQIPLAATCKVVGDELRVRQILMNLVGNAIKFTEQGSVAVRVGCEKLTSKAAFTIEIVDTGIGMDEVAKEQIFSAFYQADASHTRKYGGTGLGLAIVMQLVQLLNGRLELDSIVGQGSCFKISFSLPLVSAETMTLPEPIQRQPALVFSPNRGLRNDLTTRLKELGLVVDGVDSIADAWYRLISAARSGRPFQFVFFPAEASLPDGQALYRAIRAEKQLSTVRRILLLRAAQLMEIGEHERKLYLPVGWDGLYKAICQSWHELRVIDTQLDSDSQYPEQTQPLHLKLLLAGGNVASRELVKISLADSSIKLVVAAKYDQLIEFAEEFTPDVILLDLANLPNEPLLDFCREHQDKYRLIVHHSPADDFAPFRPYLFGTIEKPFNVERLLALLRPLLGNTVPKPEQLEVEKGG